MFDDSEGMGGRLVVMGVLATGETLYAEIIFVAGTVGASNADLRWMSDLDAFEGWKRRKRLQ